MKMKFLKPVSYLLILMTGLAITFTSCENSPKVMDLPPTESLQIDLDMFPSNGGSANKAALASYGNWGFSSLTALVWQTVLVVNVAIPVAAYAEAFNHTPVYLEDETWEWSYTVPVNGAIYEASLIGSRIDNETFSMEMYLSKSGDEDFTDFLWFSGVIRYDHTAANWSMNQSPSEPAAFLEIVYNKDFEADSANIRYTVVDPDSDLYQAYIAYGIDPAYDYDAFYTVMTGEGYTFIEWSTTSAAGRVQDENHFQDALWHCWDSLLLDVDCPAE